MIGEREKIGGVGEPPRCPEQEGEKPEGGDLGSEAHLL